jgi:integrase
VSVYKPTKGRFWHYDFQLRGHRYSGSTGATTRSKAERVEAAKRVAAASGELDRPARIIPTLGQAAAAWWQTKSSHRSADQLLSRVNLAVELVGRAKPVNAVTFADVQRAIQKRRGMLTPGKTPPANATVNRDLIATLRPTIKLARKMLNDGADPIHFPEIDWGELSLAEPKPKPKGLTAAEVERVIAALPDHLQDFVRFQARYGCRISEMFFGLDDVDVEGERVTLRNRKGGDDHTIPILPADAAMLAARISRARRAKLATVWFREEIRGKRVVLVARTLRGVGKAMSQAMTDAGVRASKGARGAHSLRHTALTNVLRATGNIRMAQQLAGHASLSSTLVYAHVLEDDLRSALDTMSRPVPELAVDDTAETCDNPLRHKES